MQNYTIRRLKLYDAINLFNLFRDISEEDKKFFHPHNFTYEDSVKVCTLSDQSLDKYYVITNEVDDIIGYGMLRGWNEGYEIPMLGIYLNPSARGKGLAERLILYMVNTNILVRIRLKVRMENIAAIKLYKKLGFKKLDYSNNYLIMEYWKE